MKPYFNCNPRRRRQLERSPNALVESRTFAFPAFSRSSFLAAESRSFSTLEEEVCTINLVTALLKDVVPVSLVADQRQSMLHFLSHLPVLTLPHSRLFSFSACFEPLTLSSLRPALILCPTFIIATIPSSLFPVIADAPAWINLTRLAWREFWESFNPKPLDGLGGKHKPERRSRKCVYLLDCSEPTRVTF